MSGHNFKAAAFDLSELQSFIQNQMYSALKQSQTQVLLVDESQYVQMKALIGDVSNVPSLTALKVLPFQSKNSTPNALKEIQNLSFFAFADPPQIQKIIAFVKLFPSLQIQRSNLNILISPQLTFYCEQLIKDSSINFQILPVNVPMFIQDVDFLTLNDQNAFAESILGGETQATRQIFDALMLIQKTYGVFGEIYYKGKMSEKLANQIYEKVYCDIRIEKLKNTYPLPQFSKLIIIDRSVDPISPLLTPVTYEALLREMCQSVGTHFYTDATFKLVPTLQNCVFQDSSQKKPQINAKLTEDQEKYGLADNNMTFSTDPVFTKIHGLQVGNVAQEIDKVAKAIKQFYAQGRNIKEQSLSTVKEIGQQIKFFRLLETKLQLHMKLIQQILAQTDCQFYSRFDVEQTLIKNPKLVDHIAIQQYIVQQIQLVCPLPSLLRLMCLYSLLNGGIDDKFYKQTVKNILHMYGFQYYPTILYLFQIGWLTTSKHPSHELQSACEFFGTHSPSDNAVFESRAPLSVRLLETICYSDVYQESFKCNSDDKKLQKYLQDMLSSNAKRCTVQEGSSLLPGGENTATILMDDLAPRKKKKKSSVIMCFVGGVSQAELTAIRQLNEARDQPDVQFGDRFSITVVASALQAGDELMQGFFDNQNQIRFIEEEGELKEVMVHDAALGRETGCAVNVEQEEEKQDQGQGQKKKRTRRQ